MRLDNVKVISFSGIDGAGKSTQIEALQAHLDQLGLRSTLYTFWDNVVVFSRFREHVSFKAFRGDKGIGSPDNPISRRDKNVTSWPVMLVRLFLYLLDAYSLRVAVSDACDSDIDFVIFDRYIFDELANLPLHRRWAQWYARLLMSFVPKPDIAYLVDADPVSAHLRKPEYPLEFVSKNRDAYVALSRLVRGITVLSPRSVEETAKRIRDSVARVCLEPESELIDVPLAYPEAAVPSKTPHG